MRYTVNLRDQPTTYLSRLAHDIAAELTFRKANSVPRCACCKHTGHNVATCGEHGFPQARRSFWEPCDCGRSDCPNPKKAP